MRERCASESTNGYFIKLFTMYIDIGKREKYTPGHRWITKYICEIESGRER